MIRVVVRDVSKSFQVSTISKRAKLKEQVLKKWFSIETKSKNLRVRHALKNVSLDVQKGQSLALIGRNGAGKSTLLKMIAGSLSVDHGQIDISGKVGGLVELNAGLDMSKSGRENVFDRARVLGISREKMEKFAAEVEKFSELGDQYDDPVGAYSSGMKARLGFAISVTLPFDIMICDEALSVGDARFAAKCLAKVNQLKSERVFLFVSHSMAMVQRFCDKAIVLEKGEMVFSGTTSDAAAFYENNILHMSSAEIEHIGDFEASKESQLILENQREFLQPLFINKEVVNVWHAEALVDSGIEVHWDFEFTDIRSNDVAYRLGFPLFSSDGTMLFGCAQEDLLESRAGVRHVRGSLTIPAHGLHPGVYYLVISLFEGMSPILRQLVTEIKIHSEGKPRFGVYAVRHEWKIQYGSPQQDNDVNRIGS